MIAPRIDHMGIVVADLDAAVTMFTSILVGSQVHAKDLPDVGLRIAIFEAANISIELIQYTEDGSEFAQGVMGAAPGLNHFSVEVANLEPAAADMEATGF